jgi:hypothetical protein
VPTQSTAALRIDITWSRNLKKTSEPAHHAAIRSIVSLALDILEHNKSVQALIFVGATAVEGWGKKGRGTSPEEIIFPTEQTGHSRHIYKRPGKEEMEKWVTFFLRAIRRTFPPVEVSNLGRDRQNGTGDSGQFERHDWVPGAKRRCELRREAPSKENIMLHWEPEYSGRMWLDRDVSPLTCETHPSSLR